jgi:transposase
VVCNAQGKPVAMLLSEGQMSDYKGARVLLIADRGYDAAWFRAALRTKGITPCIPTKRNRKIQIEYDKTLYRQRHRIENMFGRLKDWRRIAKPVVAKRGIHVVAREPGGEPGGFR